MTLKNWHTHVSLGRIRQLVQKKAGTQMNVTPLLMLMQTGYVQKSIYSPSSEGEAQKAHAGIWVTVQSLIWVFAGRRGHFVVLVVPPVAHIPSAKIKSIQVIFFTPDWRRMKIHCCLMHIWKHGLSGYVAGQTILDFYVNDEWCDTSNIRGVVFCFSR